MSNTRLPEGSPGEVCQEHGKAWHLLAHRVTLGRVH